MKAKTAVIILTIYLIVYAAFFQTGLSITLLAFMFLLSPVLVIWTVYLVLRDGTDKYPELDKVDEWGYLNKAKDELGLF